MHVIIQLTIFCLPFKKCKFIFNFPTVLFFLGGTQFCTSLQGQCACTCLHIFTHSARPQSVSYPAHLNIQNQIQSTWSTPAWYVGFYVLSNVVQLIYTQAVIQSLTALWLLKSWIQAGLFLCDFFLHDFILGDFNLMRLENVHHFSNLW